MIELAEGIWVAPEHVSLIKAIDDESCMLLMVGQSALEGHVLPYSAGEVVEAVNDYFEDGEDEPEEEEE